MDEDVLNARLIAERRRELGLTRAQVARSSRMAPDTIHALERGESHGQVTLRQLVALADVLERSTLDLLVKPTQPRSAAGRETFAVAAAFELRPSEARVLLDLCRQFPSALPAKAAAVDDAARLRRAGIVRDDRDALKLTPQAVFALSLARRRAPRAPAVRGSPARRRDVAREVAAFLDQQSAPTRRAYSHDIKRWIEHLAEQHVHLLAATDGDLADHRSDLIAAGHATSTADRACCAITALHHYLAALGMTERGLSRVASSGTPPRFDAGPTPEQRQRLREAAISEPRTRALVTLLLDSHLRIGTCVRLDVDDLKLDSYAASMRIAGQADHGRVPINGDTVGALRRCVRDRTSGPVFLNHRGGRLSSRSARDFVLRAAREAHVTPDNRPITTDWLRM
jgi:site-specific recombinase XerD/transcriptional regulator with XRE-family HTH domain